MATILSKLEQLRDRLKDESAWTQKVYARDEMSMHVEATSPRAVCWCLKGALNADYEAPATPRAEHLLETLIDGRSLISFNDDATYVEVMRLIWRGINVAGQFEVEVAGQFEVEKGVDQ